MRHRLWGLLGLLGLALALTFPKSTLYVEGNGKRHLLKVEVADTPERWAQGLMFRERLGEDEGMVFLFPEPTAGGFWMKNTLIPLSIAFFDRQGVILRILAMEPGRPLPRLLPGRGLPRGPGGEPGLVPPPRPRRGGPGRGGGPEALAPAVR